VKENASVRGRFFWQKYLQKAITLSMFNLRKKNKPLNGNIMLKKTALFLVLITTPMMAFSEIYRWVDENGKVVFSDKPKEGASKVKLPGISTIKSVTPSAGTTSAPESKKTTPKYYSEFGISMPKDDQAIRANSGRLEVKFTIKPQLRPGHTILLELDDKKIRVNNVSHVLENIDRGTHTIRATIQDSEGNKLTPTHSIKVHILRHSILFKKKKSSTTP
jgi:hypothetical protein